MMFLNPWFLIGLAAAGIPVLIHLLNLKKLRTVEFSSLRFLKELQKSRIRTLRIRQLLLLILRTLVIVFLVLAFARPTMRGPFAGFFGGRAAGTTVILLDDSPSMTIRDEHGVRFEQARQAVSRIVASAEEQDRIVFALLSSLGARPLAIAPSVSSALRVIADAQPTVVHKKWSALFPALRPIVDGSPQAHIAIYIVSDGQASQFVPLSVGADSAIGTEEWIQGATLRIGTVAEHNTAVLDVTMQTQVLSAGKPVRLQATIRQTGSTQVTNALVSAYIDGKRVAQRSLELAPDTPAPVVLDVTPKRPGSLSGYVQIEDDAFETDNTRHFSLRIPKRIRVLVFGETPADSYYPALALTLGGDSSLAGLFQVRTEPLSHLASFDARAVDVLVLSGIPRMTGEEAAAVARFAAAGGGVILFAGAGVDRMNYNKVLLPQLGLPALPEARPQPQDSLAPPDQNAGFLTFSRMDIDHPLLRTLLARPTENNPAKPPVESPRVVRYGPTPYTLGGRRIIGLSDGGSFLADFPVRNGRLLWFSVDAATRDSDFPLRGIFVPLIHRAAVYLAGAAETPAHTVAGNPLMLSLPRGRVTHGGRFTLTSPSGNNELLIPRGSPAIERIFVESSPTTEIGTYCLYEERVSSSAGYADPITLAAVNIDSAESNLRPATEPELARFWESGGIGPDRQRQLTAGETLENSIHEARSGVELWKYCILIALICAVLEMLIARVSASEVPSA